MAKNLSKKKTVASKPVRTKRTTLRDIAPADLARVEAELFNPPMAEFSDTPDMMSAAYSSGGLDANDVLSGRADDLGPKVNELQLMVRVLADRLYALENHVATQAMGASRNGTRGF